MNKELVTELRDRATANILGVPVVDHDRFAQLIVEECAGILMSQDVDPAFKSRMAHAMRARFGIAVPNIG